MTIPDSVEAFGEDMSLVYEWCVNRILINIAKRFPYIVDEEARGGFEWQAAKLAEFGQVNEENMAILRQSLSGVPDFLRDGLEREIIAAIERVEPDLKQAAERGFLPGEPPPMAGAVQRELDAYYRQAADKMNLVNTVMLDSTEQAYKDVVTDVVMKTERTQQILDNGAGSVITGVESLNSATRQAVGKMVENGLTGFIDHAGRRWRPEAYAMMDIRTTTMNAARQAAFDRCDDFGSDIIQVDSHAGARPLCYPWQGKLISRTDFSRDVEDLYGTKVHVYALSETSYGQPAGLFGINCRHFGTPFIPGFSGLGNKNLIQDKKENDERYQLTQEQRGMERAIRDARLRANVAKARGDKEEEEKWRDKAKELSDRIGDFCEEHGLPRRKDREYTPVDAKWPAGREKGPFPYKVQPYKGNAGNGSVTQIKDYFPEKPEAAPTPAQAPMPPPTPAPAQDEAKPTFTPAQDEAKPTFTPAKTIAEAEEQGRKYVGTLGSVSYKGIGLEYANTCNNVLGQVMDRFDVPGLGSIQPMNMRSKLFRNSTAEAAYRWGGIGGDLFINPTYYKNGAAFRKHKAEVDGLMATVLANGQKLLDSGKYTGTRKTYIETLLRTKRQCVAQSHDFVEASFVHECGHMLDDKLFRKAMGGGHNRFDVLNESRNQYGPYISGYAVSDNQEYVAESFTAWWYGEGDIIDPWLRDIFERAVRQ